MPFLYVYECNQHSGVGFEVLLCNASTKRMQMHPVYETNKHSGIMFERKNLVFALLKKKKNARRANKLSLTLSENINAKSSLHKCS